MKPITATNPPEPTIAAKADADRSPAQARTAIAITKVTTIETPPPLGVGVECELRAFGTSIKLLARAYLRSNAVRSRDTKAIAMTDSHSIMFVVFQIISSSILHGVFNTHRWMPVQHRTGFTDIDLQRAA